MTRDVTSAALQKVTEKGTAERASLQMTAKKFSFVGFFHLQVFRISVRRRSRRTF